MLKLNHNSLEQVLIPGLERAVLWDYKQDNVQVSRYIRTLQDMEREIRYCKSRYIELYHQLKAAKHKIIKEFENNVDRIWNDQKSGTYFRNGQPFNPHQVVKKKNLVMWDGLTRFTELIAMEAGVTFDKMAMGTGITEPTFSDITLETEIARIDLQVSGDINADGIILKNSGVFPPNVPSATVSEFGAFDNGAAGTMEYRVVITEPTERLGHIMGITQVQASHSIAFIALENIL